MYIYYEITITILLEFIESDCKKDLKVVKLYWFWTSGPQMNCEKKIIFLLFDLLRKIANYIKRV